MGMYGREKTRGRCWLGMYGRRKTRGERRVLVGHVWKKEDIKREEGAGWACVEEGRLDKRGGTGLAYV